MTGNRQKLCLKHQQEGSGCSPSFSMPTLRHLVKRHAWQAFLRLLVISHSFDAGQLYSMLPGGGGVPRQGSKGSPTFAAVS